MTFIVTCIFTVLYLIRPFEVISSFVHVPILFYVGIISCVLLILDTLSGKIDIFKSNTDKMMLGLYCAIGLSHLSHFYINGAIQSMKDFFPVFVGYFLIVHSINSVNKLKIFLALLVLVISFLACEGIMEARRGYSFFGVEPLYQNGGINSDGSPIILLRTKWVGPFSDPNDFAMLFIVPIPILLNYLSTRFFLIPTCLLALMLRGLYLTGSRGGFLSLVAVVSAYYILRFKSTKGLIIGLCSGFLFLMLGSGRMGNISSSESSAYGRLEAWYSGYQMFKSAPLMGVGKGMFTEYNYLTAHNSFVLIFSELGIFGSIFFFGIFYYSIVAGYQIIFKNNIIKYNDKKLLFIYYAMLSNIVAVLTAMFFLSRAYVLLPYIIVAISTSIVGLITDNDKNYFFYKSINYKIIVFLTFITIFIINIVIKVLL